MFLILYYCIIYLILCNTVEMEIDFKPFKDYDFKKIQKCLSHLKNEKKII